MSDDLINTCALFFFLITLDDKIATDATIKTIRTFKQKYSKPAATASFKSARSSTNSEESSGMPTSSYSQDIEILVKLCLQEWESIRIHFRKERIQIINTKSLHWPEHIDLNPWKEFQKQAPEKELIAVTWVHVLGISEAILAHCMNQSEGTVRYRVGNGLVLLGQLNRPNISALQFS